MGCEWNNDAAEYIKQWRVRNKYSQLKLAQALGYGVRMIKSWESGERVPKVNIYLAMEFIELKSSISHTIEEFNQKVRQYVGEL